MMMMMMMTMMMMTACLQSGYYGLSENNVAGCLPCDCDIGGSLDSVCDVTSGQCPCRDHLTGRTCRQPVSRALLTVEDQSSPDFFVPTFTHLTFEAEEATTLGDIQVGYMPPQAIRGGRHYVVPMSRANTDSSTGRRRHHMTACKMIPTDFSLRGTVVKCWSLTGELYLCCARPAADG